MNGFFFQFFIINFKLTNIIFAPQNNCMQIGNKILVVDDDLRGVITKIKADKVTFMSDEGFEYVYAKNKIVVVNMDVENLFLQGNPRKNIVSNKVVSKKNTSKKPPVFDLHIEKIQPKHHHLSAGQKLQIQLDEAHRIIRKMQLQKQKSFILVHGVGKGVLKKELTKLLKVKKLRFEEASFLDFGHGSALRVFF